MSSKSRELRLQILGNGATALAKEYEACFGSAAGVCLEDRGHTSPVELMVSGFCNEGFSLDWHPATDDARRTWQDEQQTTEFGAYGVALVLMRTIAHLKAFEVSRKYNGFDFWMTSKKSLYPFQKSARLEVSGFRGGSEKKKSRLREKSVRLQQYSNPLPAFTVVVEFGEPGALVGQQQ
jgi:hypothetical protein